MRVRYDEGVANHIGPEPCAGLREGAGEASVGERIGQPLSRERLFISDADAVIGAEGKTDGRVSASAWPVRRGLRPWHVRTLLVREPGDLWIGHRPQDDGADGPHREGEEPKPVMHDLEKSDSGIVAGKPTNKAGSRRRSRWSQGPGPRGTRTGNACTGSEPAGMSRRRTAYGSLSACRRPPKAMPIGLLGCGRRTRHRAS